MPILDVFWTMLWFFLFFIWLMLLFRVFMDIFRSEDMGGWGKALWVIFVVVLPFLGILVYIIARGKGMAERDVNSYQAAEAANQQYIRETVGAGSSADEIQKLAALRDQGVISDDEFAAQKAKLLA